MFIIYLIYLRLKYFIVLKYFQYYFRQPYNTLRYCQCCQNVNTKGLEQDKTIERYIKKKNKWLGLLIEPIVPGSCQ